MTTNHTKRSTVDVDDRAPSTRAGRIAVVYAVGAAAWILVSDHWIDDRILDLDSFVVLQNIKGLLFVAVTSVLLYGALVIERRRMQKLERERFTDLERIRLLSEHARDLVHRYRVVEPRGFEYVSPSSTQMTGYTPEDHYADPLLGTKLVHEDDRHLVEGPIEDVSGDPVVLRWRHRDGRVIWTERRNVPVVDESGRTVAIEGITRDVTNIMAVREELADALADAESARHVAERSEDLANRLRTVIATLVEIDTKDEVLQEIIDAGVEAARAESCVVGMIDATGRVLEIRAVRQERSPSLEEFRKIPLDAETVPTHVIRTGEPVWLRDRTQAEADHPGMGATMEDFGTASFACLPLEVEGRKLGAISLAYDEPQDFDPPSRTFLVALAQQCANAYARTDFRERLEDSRRRLRMLSTRLIQAQEAERRHIARELHDEFGQLLGALKFDLHVLIDKHRRAGTELPDELRESLTILDELFRNVRSLSRELRPAVLDDLGLPEALEWLAERFEERSTLQVALERRGDEDVELSPGIATTAYRIVQESLTNVTRHAEASRATIVLETTPEGLQLEIRDDGCGFDVEQALERSVAGSSLGLLSVTERAELVGGRAEIDSVPGGHGSTVRIWLPLVEYDADGPPRH